jgi:hypothetical protein
MVFNTCTDSGLAGLKVYLKMYYRKKEFADYTTTSDAAGNYTFANVEIHADQDYEQCVHIPSKSGDNARDFETCGILGTSMWFTFEEADVFMKPRVRPSFIYFAFYFPRQQTTVASDSIIARFEQRTYHKNVPDYPYKFGAGSTGDRSGYTSHWGIGNYPMGLYHIRVDKWINGQLTRWNDSVFVNYGDTSAYVVHW